MRAVACFPGHMLRLKRLRVGPRRHGESIRSGLRLFDLRAQDVDAAFEKRAVFNDDTRGFDVAHNASPRHDDDPLDGFHISLNPSPNHQFVRFYIRLYLAVGADRQAMADFKARWLVAV